MSSAAIAREAIGGGEVEEPAEHPVRIPDEKVPVEGTLAQAGWRIGNAELHQDILDEVGATVEEETNFAGPRQPLPR